MPITRRAMLALLASMGSARQGVAPRTVKPQPRGRPSGRPFPSRFTDIAAQAGLIHPTVYGGVDTKRFIIETSSARVSASSNGRGSVVSKGHIRPAGPAL